MRRRRDGDKGSGTTPPPHPAPLEQPPAAGGAKDSSRRGFLKGAAIAGIGAAVGAGGTAIGVAAAQNAGHIPEFTPIPKRSEPGFDHIVVLMFENRSFDNVLGRLYDPANLPAGQKFEGLEFGDYSNTAPDGTVVAAHVYRGQTDQIMRFPNPDPGEEYSHVNTQLFNTVRPESNAGKHAWEVDPPYNAPEDTSRPDMSGFVNDYINHIRTIHQGRKEPTEEEYRVVMGGYSPDMLPVFTTLARNFAVFDHWFCAVPSQTFCNRSFFHASTSHGYVTNGGGTGHGKWLDPDLTSPTIFNRLEEAGLSWKVYYDELQMISYTGFLHEPVLRKFWKTEHFGTMADFYADAENGTLPAYAFIEPRLTYNHNDMHPPIGRVRVDEVDGTLVVDGAISDVRAGETLLHDVYSAVKHSTSSSGSNALNTLLLVTFDEHGGIYDHVPPPAATPPGSDRAGEMGFTFDRLGARVPTIAISAYTRAGTVVNEEMHHGSVIATLCEQYGLEPLTERDRGANTLRTCLNLTEPRHPDNWPQTLPSFVPSNPEAIPAFHETAKEHPLSPPAHGVLGLLLAEFAPDEPTPQTFGEAYHLLNTHGKGLFGPQ